MTNLTLPGTIPGLLRRGSPIALVDTPGCPRHLVGRLGVIHSVVGDLCSYSLDGVGLVVTSCVEAVALDLTDATGRVHAAWWLSGRTSPTDEVVLSARWVWGNSRPGWFLDRGPTYAREWFWLEGPLAEMRSALQPCYVPRLLPDGSRWVDAEALRRVCLHVLGGE